MAKSQTLLIGGFNSTFQVMTRKLEFQSAVGGCVVVLGMNDYVKIFELFHIL